MDPRIIQTSDTAMPNVWLTWQIEVIMSSTEKSTPLWSLAMFLDRMTILISRVAMLSRVLSINFTMLRLKVDLSSYCRFSWSATSNLRLCTNLIFSCRRFGRIYCSGNWSTSSTVYIFFGFCEINDLGATKLWWRGANHFIWYSILTILAL